MKKRSGKWNLHGTGFCCIEAMLTRLRKLIASGLPLAVTSACGYISRSSSSTHESTTIKSATKLGMWHLRIALLPRRMDSSITLTLYDCGTTEKFTRERERLRRFGKMVLHEENNCKSKECFVDGPPSCFYTDSKLESYANELYPLCSCYIHRPRCRSSRLYQYDPPQMTASDT